MVKLFGGHGTTATDAVSGVARAAFAGRTYYPTIMIGLGGTGAETLLRVKKLLVDRAGDRLHLHRFLFIDTDLRTFAPREGLPPIETDEQCLIGVRWADQLVANPNLHPEILSRFPRSELKEGFIRNLARGEGAGQIRSIGALAYALDYRSIRQRISQAYRNVIDLSESVQQVLANAHAEIGTDIAVYIVGSLAGGTGSGCFLDLALTVESVCESHKARILGLFALPRGFDEKVANDPGQTDRIRANTYAALKELQFVLDTDAPERPAQVEYDYGEAGRLSLPKSNKLFELVYVFDILNQRGRLPKLEELYELMARTVYQDVGSPFGAHAQSFNSNCGVLTGVTVCPETNRTRLLSSGATSSLIYPAERTSLYCTYRSLAEVVADEMLEKTSSLHEIQQKVSVFLAQEKMEERGAVNQIIETLLSEPKKGEVLSSSFYGLPRTWGGSYDGPVFVAQIRDKWNQFRNEEVPEVSKIIKQNLERRLHGSEDLPRDVIRERVERWAIGVAASDGLGAARKAIEELTSVCQKMKNELVAELDDWNTNEREATRQIFDRNCLLLSGMSWLGRQLSSKDERLEKQLILDFNRRVDGELDALAKADAIRIAEHLENVARTVQANWDRLAVILADLIRRSQELASRLESRRRGVTRDFVVELEVTQPGYERRYYETNRRPTSEVLSALLELRTVDDENSEGAARISLYRWMLSVSGLTRSLEVIGEQLGAQIYGKFWERLLETDLIQFIEKNPAEVGETLEGKLKLAFEMCQPFWPARPIQSGMYFPEFMAVTVRHEAQAGKQATPPRLVREWISKFGPKGKGGVSETVSSDIPYEIMISRRTHGARVHYFGPARDWAVRYRKEKKIAKGRFMLESHSAYLEIPDPIPQDARPMECFALGVALGFVAVRGDHYYYGLTEKKDADGRPIIAVQYASQWGTIQTLQGVPPVPQDCGRLKFMMKNVRSISVDQKFGQGRQAAVDALGQKPEWTSLIEQAFGEYHQTVGNPTLRAHFQAYIDQVLDPAIDKAGDRGDLLREEKRLIEERMANLGM